MQLHTIKFYHSLDASVTKMKTLFIFLALFLVQATWADDGGVKPKVCEDFLPQQTCENLRKVAKLLHEKATIIQDAVKHAIAHHKTKAAEMLAYIKAYIADRFQCEKVLTPDICQTIFALGKRVHLTVQQVRLAIETAVANGAKTAKDIYSKAVKFLTTEINCENILGKEACDKLRSAITKFHEQTSLLSEALMTAAQKHINNTIETLKFVKQFLLDKVINFKCENVLPQDKCAAIRDIATRLHLTTQQVRKAIKEAVVNGAKSVVDVYNKTLDFLTTQINCANILGQTACDNLIQAAKKLGEQTILIKEAIMAAAKKHLTTAAAILKSVKDRMVELAVNFKCTDVLSNFQCTQIKRIADHFKIKATELRRVLIEAVINGTATAKQIYDKTIGGLIEDAKNIKCVDLIPEKICKTLDDFAEKLQLKISEVTMAVKVAIANGVDVATGLVKFVKTYLAEKLSCEKVLGKNLCDTIEDLANMFHISFKKVIEKLRSLVANGITSVTQLYLDIIQYIRDLFNEKIFGKRSVDDTVHQILLKKIMALIDHTITVGKDVRDHIKEQLKNLLANGKMKIGEILNLIEKYQPNDEDITVFRRSVVDDLKEALKKAQGKVKDLIKKLLTKSKEELEKLKAWIKTLIPTDVSDKQFDVANAVIEEMLYQAADEEVKLAGEKIEQMLTEEL